MKIRRGYEEVIDFSICSSSSLGFGKTAEATLWDRGGGLIYDDVLNITWLQDASYAKFGMPWDDAMAWVENLEYYDLVRKIVWTDWRLPDARNWDGSGPDAYAYVTNSEMGHMFYNNLCGSPGSFPGTDFIDGNGNSVSFYMNPDAQDWWYSNEWDQMPDWGSWYFVFSSTPSSGQQYRDSKHHTYQAWAVRDGDVNPIPEPSTMFLLGVGLIKLLSLYKKCQYL